MRIGVFMGGKSIEKEVSLNSGRTVCDHLDTNRFEIVPLFLRDDSALFILPWQFLYRGKISDFATRLDLQAQRVTWDELPSIIDFAYLAMPGRYGEDGILQGIMELFNIPYLGSRLLSSALCMNKSALKNILRQQNIAVPRDLTLRPSEAIYINRTELVALLEKKNLNYPLVVKPNQEGSSLGVSVVNTPEELITTVHHAASIYPPQHQAVLIEEKIIGMEFSCIVLWDHLSNRPLPLPPTEIVIEAGTTIFDYEQKYMPGRATKYTPPRCDQMTVNAIQQTCLRVTDALEMKTIARIDGFVQTDGTVVIVDPNTLSGMAPNSFLFREAAEVGMGHRQLINHLIDSELAQRGITPIQTTKESRMNKKRKRVAVLFGGRSREREISLESGRNVCYKLADRYEVIPLFVCSDLTLQQITDAQLVCNSTAEIESRIKNKSPLPWSSLSIIADFVFIALHGGEGENGTVQGMLEMLEVPYNGSGVFTSALCIDKAKTSNFLKQAGFAVPTHRLVTRNEWYANKDLITEQIQYIPFPLITKPHDDGCSVMVHKAETVDQLKNGIETIFATEKRCVLVEEYITGMELTVGVMGNEDIVVFTPSQTISSTGVLSTEEKFLPGAGENQTPAPLDQQAVQLVQETIGHVYQTVGCSGYARIDCFYQSGSQSPSTKPRVVILEINTLPGLTPATCLFHQAAEAGIKPLAFLEQIIELGLEKHANAIPLNLRTSEKPRSL